MTDVVYFGSEAENLIYLLLLAVTLILAMNKNYEIAIAIVVGILFIKEFANGD